MTKSQITRANSHEPFEGPKDWFTGQVKVDILAQNDSAISVARVSFEKGARTAWHKHPLGQTLIVEKGEGWTQTENGRKETFREGDVIWCPHDIRHWHGATKTSPMTHLAITPFKDGKNVEWFEHVSDEVYEGGE